MYYYKYICKVSFAPGLHYKASNLGLNLLCHICGPSGLTGNVAVCLKAIHGRCSGVVSVDVLSDDLYIIYSPLHYTVKYHLLNKCRLVKNTSLRETASLRH